MGKTPMDFHSYFDEAYAFGAKRFVLGQQDVKNMGKGPLPLSGIGTGSSMFTKPKFNNRPDLNNPPYSGGAQSTAFTKTNPVPASSFSPTSSLKYYKIAPSTKWPKTFK